MLLAAVAVSQALRYQKRARLELIADPPLDTFRYLGPVSIAVWQAATLC
jgi:hypothetical protein